MGDKGSSASREVALKQSKAQVNKYTFYLFYPHFIGWFGWISAHKVVFNDLSMCSPGIFSILYTFTKPWL